jgi:hypothetical protein
MSGSTHEQAGSISSLKHHDGIANKALGQRNEGNVASSDIDSEERSVEEVTVLERKLVRKIDLRLCTIAGILCSLNLLDSGIISSASVTSIFEDLGLGVGNRYVSFLSDALSD